MLTRRDFSAAFTGAVAVGFAAPAVAAKAKVFTRGGIALGGYDPVAYFEVGKPARGAAQYALAWQGADWYFSSAENKDRFAAAPESYAPAYGGYCAYAVSRNYTASTVPEAWHIWRGRLFLNYSKSVRLLWRADIPGNVRRGDQNWPSVLSA